MTTVQTLENPENLRERWDAYREEHKRARIYDAAQALQTSEVQLLATDCGTCVTRLKGDWGDVLKSLEGAGEVMALTRNHWAVIEKKGLYKPVSLNGHVALVLDEGIDLRIFLNNWKTGFAVELPEHPAYRFSLQFFDGAGCAVHKIYFPAEASEAFAAIVDKHRAEEQGTMQSVSEAPAPAAAKDDREIDVRGMLEAWRNLQDTHDFYGLLKKFGVTRTQACRLAEGCFTRRLPVASHRTAFEKAASAEIPIMVFAGNHGCIEIHTGTIRNLIEARGWYNIMDPGFNLHLLEEGIRETWLVRKPTRDGIVTSVEVYDGAGKEIIQIFGKRKPGIPELDSWRAIAEELPGL